MREILYTLFFTLKAVFKNQRRSVLSVRRFICRLNAYTNADFSKTKQFRARLWSLLTINRKS